MTIRLKMLVSCCALVCGYFPAPAMAEGLIADDEASREIVVTGHYGDYAATEANSTKTGTALIDTPQTIQVVTRQQLDDQAQHSLGEVLRYIPGITVGQGEGNRDQITLRGQNSTADFFLDGVRDDVQYYRGLYNLERVEVLKGPASLLFGRGGGGGVVNRVQKTAKLEGGFVAGNASVNSFGAYDIAADLNGPITKNVAIRINANYEGLNNHRDYYGGDRYAWNPTASIALSPEWRLGLSYEYVHDDRVTDRGIPSLNNAPITGYRDQFFGTPGVNRTGLEAQIARANIDGAITNNLSLSATVLYGDYDKFYTNVYASGPLISATNLVPLAGYNEFIKRQNAIAQANFVWSISTGPLSHKILFGGEYGTQNSDSGRRDALFATGTSAALNLSNPVFPVVQFPILTRANVSKVTFASAFVQDQISIGSHVQIVAGLRYDRFKISGIELTAANRPFGRTDEKVSPRFGLILKPTDNLSFYGSYSQSFQPRSGNQFTALTIEQQNLAPEKFVNYEIGAKWNPLPNFNLAMAVFQLDRSNATVANPLNPLVTINVGGTRVKGAEISISGQVTENWQLSGGYAYQDGALSGNDTVRLAQVPKHQASLWNRYNFNKAFGIGLGVIHQSSQFAAIRTSAATTILPAFTRVDAALFYTINDKVKLQANVENLIDTEYFPDAHNNNNISTGAPINGRISVSVKF